MDPEEMECETLDSIYLTEAIVQMRAVVNTVMNLLVP
jgi:hypothetical protein